MSTHIRSNINSKFSYQQVLVLTTKSSLDIFRTLDTRRRVKPRKVRHHTSSEHDDTHYEVVGFAEMYQF